MQRPAVHCWLLRYLDRWEVSTEGNTWGLSRFMLVAFVVTGLRMPILCGKYN
jgi:hypothetical protein